jgi:hypothetical protein
MEALETSDVVYIYATGQWGAARRVMMPLRSSDLDGSYQNVVDVSESIGFGWETRREVGYYSLL